MSEALIACTERLRAAVSGGAYGAPVTHVYNPLDYAWEPHCAYLRRVGEAPGRTILLGMNPGPWGMAQTGVPFGEVALARDWLGVSGRVDQPAEPHPKRPIDGFDCARSEVSGRRLWGWARDRFGTADAFLERFAVLNYCPLVFMEASGRNRTPDKLPVSERAPLFAACDQGLIELVEVLRPERIVGVGAFAQARAKAALGRDVGRVLHPSPASPLANKGWAERAEVELEALGISLS